MDGYACTSSATRATPVRAIAINDVAGLAESYRERHRSFFSSSPLHYMPTAIQRAVSFAFQPDAVTAVNELRVTACNDNGFCQYDEPSWSTYVATTAKQRAGNVRGNDVA